MSEVGGPQRRGHHRDHEQRQFSDVVGRPVHLHRASRARGYGDFAHCRTTAGGTSVIITGTSFTWAINVTFGIVPATSVTVNSDTQITAVAPFLPTSRKFPEEFS